MILKVESIEVCLDCGNLSVVVEAQDYYRIIVQRFLY